MSVYHEPTRKAAKGKWRGILLALGMHRDTLSGKHTSCPMCGGKDRFRWDNDEGRGTYICGQCGAGDGLTLAMEFTGDDFASTAAKIDGLLGNKKFDPDEIKPRLSGEDIRIAKRRVWAATRPVSPGDVVDTYLRSRGICELAFPADLRTADALPDGEGCIRPAMVAMVRGPDGAPATLHRTFLAPGGKGKAQMASPRKLMPGDIPPGACIRLADWTSGPIGIAEGIETALRAGDRFEMPAWAAVTSGGLARWAPPAGSDAIAIFGDNDPKFGGQAAAYALGHRLAVKGVEVTIHIPGMVGKDWADF